MSLNYKAKRTGLKGFFLFHSEKVLLVLAFVALATFFALGYGGESFDSSKSPDALKAQVEQVKGKLKVDTWPNVAEQPERVAPTNHGVRAQIARNPVSEVYQSPVLDTPIFKELVKRTDPEIYAPEQIEVAVSIGAVAQRAQRGVKVVDTLEDSVDPKIDPPKQPRSRNPRGPAAGSPYGDVPTIGGEYGSGSPYGTDPTKPTVKQLTPYLQQKFQKDYYTISTPANLKGAYVVAVKAVVPLKRQRDEFERTFKDATGFDPMRDRPEIVWFEAERAEVTMPGMTEDQLTWTLISDTDKALQQARLAASQPQEPADPRYLLPGMITFPIPPMVMVKLKDLGLHSLIPARKTPASLRAERTAKRGPNGEAVGADGEAVEEEATTRGPKALPRGPGMGSGDPYGGSSPYGSESPYGDMAYGDSSMYGDPSMMGAESGYGDVATVGDSSMYGSEGSGMYGSSPYGSSGYADPMAGIDYKLVRFFDFDAQPGKTYRYRVRLFYRDPNNLFAIRSGAGTAAAAAGAAGGGATGYEAASSYASAGYGSGMGGTGGPLKEYMLTPEVLTRLNSIPEAEGGAEEVYYRTTEWSAPSSDVVVPFAPEKRFVGDGEAARRFPLPSGGDFPTPLSEAHAKIAVSRWDNARAVDVPTEIDARRGTVLNKVGDVDVLHPLKLAGAGMGGMGVEMGGGGSPYGPEGAEIDPYAPTVDPYSAAGVAASGPMTPIRRLEGYNFRTDSVVLDIRGGEKLPGGDPRNPQNSPTLALMVDRFGNLEFASEVADAEAYRDTLFIDPTPEKKAEAMKKAQEEAAKRASEMQSMPTGSVSP